MDGYVTIATELDTKEFDAQIDYVKSQLDDIEDKLKQADMGFEVGDTLKLEAQYEKLTQKLKNLIKKKEQFNQTKMVDFSGIQNSINNVGKSMNKVTKKIAKWGLALFGIRAMYGFIRSSINTIAGDDAQLQADIDYMKSALAYTIEPVVRTIINLVKQLMFYVGYIVKAWTGKNIFENANKGLTKANKQAKELQKTTAGFDEMNVVGGETSSGGLGSTTPSFDLSKIEDIDAPKWLKFIVKNKKVILATLGGIATALTLIKFNLAGIKALGIGIAIAGIIYSIEKIIDFMNDPTFDNFVGILQGIAVAVTGIGIAFGLVTTGVAGAVALIMLTIIQFYDEIKKFFKRIIKWFDEDFKGGLEKVFGPIGDVIYLPIKRAIEHVYSSFSNFYGGLKKVVEGIVEIFKGDLWGGIKKIIEGLLQTLLSPWIAMYDGAKAFIEGAIEIFKNFGNWIYENVIKKIGKFFEDLWNGVKNTFSNVWNWIINKFSQGGQIFNGLKEGIADIFKNVVNTLISGINKVIKTPFEKINSLLNTIREVNIPIINKKPFKGLWGNNPLPIVQIPKLAKGGIINMPGKGVPVGSAIGGERGAEGVLPLTDSQQMALLGEAIGRYININATIPVYVGNRQIAREIQKINAEEDFAFNG
jgi:hypothetical protein